MKYIIVVLLMAASLAATPRPPQEDGRKICTNYKTTKAEDKCECLDPADTCPNPDAKDVKNDAKCKNNCFMKNCDCIGACDT